MNIIEVQNKVTNSSARLTCVPQGSFNPSGSEEADSDFDPEAGESAAGVARKRKSTGRRRSAGKPAKRGRKPKGKKGRVRTTLHCTVARYPLHSDYSLAYYNFA